MQLHGGSYQRIQLSFEGGTIHYRRRNPKNPRLSKRGKRHYRRRNSKNQRLTKRGRRQICTCNQKNPRLTKRGRKQIPHGPNAKNQSGREWGARVGAGIGKFAGALVSPLRRAQTDAINSQTYQCRQCGTSYRMGNLKRDIVPHLRRPANKKCLDLYSESSDKREMESVHLASPA